MALSAAMASWIGVTLLAGSLLLLDDGQPFPGWRALPPTMGAALLIFAGEFSSACPVRMLRWRPVVVIGVLSYSAYLWHWPLFALYRYGYGEPGILAATMLIAITMALAAVSYRYIEIPTRQSHATFASLVVRQLVAPASILTAASLVVVYGERFGVPLASSHYRFELAQLREITRPAYTFDWICQRQRLTPSELLDARCVSGKSKDAHVAVLMLGDSNAAHYVPMVREIANEAGFSFRNIAIGSCPPLLVNAEPFVDARRIRDCRDSMKLVLTMVPRFPVLIVSASWVAYQERSPEFLDQVEAALRDLAGQGHIVILLGRAPILEGFDRRCAEKALRVPFKQCTDIPQPLSTSVIELNTRLRQFAERTPNVRYFDGNDYLCPNRMCRQKGASGLPRFFDSGHLSVSGATELAQMILQRDGIPGPFADSAAWSAP